jgi:type I restriction enzyme S subunit
MYPLRPVDDRLSKGFLFHLLLSEPFSKQAISFQDRTGIPKINRQQLGRIQIPIPSRHEQDEIASSLDTVDTKLSLHRRKHTALSGLFRTLLHELMTARIRVHNLDLPELEAAIKV